MAQTPQLTIGTGHYHDVAVGFAKPKLQVIGKRIDVQALKHLASRFDGALIDGLDVFGHEPQNNSVAVRLDRWIAQVRVFMGVPAMKLKGQRPL